MPLFTFRLSGARPLRALFGSAALASMVSVGCLPPTNPCDPEAPDDVQARVDLAGVVRDQNGLPLGQVTVAVDETGQTATTNEDGQFQLTNLPPSTSYSLSAYPEGSAVGGTIIVDNLGCNEARGELELPVVVPPDAPEVEITAATAPNRMFVAFPSVLTDPHEVEQTPMSVVTTEGNNPCQTEIDDGAPEHRYWLEVRAPFGTWQRALLNPDPINSKHAQSIDLDGAYAYLGEGCLRATCGYFSYAFDVLNDQANARCVEVVGFMDGLNKQPLEPFATYQVRVRTDHLVSVETAQSGSLPSAVTSTPSTSPERLSLTPTATLPVPLSVDDDVNADMLADLDIDNIVPVADGRFALVASGGLLVVGAGSLEAQIRNGVAPGVAAEMSDNAASVEGGMFMDDVTTEATQAEVTANNAHAIDLLPAGKWVRVLKRQNDGSTMIDKVWVGDSWGTAPMNNNPDQPVLNVDMNTSSLSDRFLGFRWLGGIEGDPSDPEAPYNPPDAYLLLFEDGVTMFEAVDSSTGNDDTYMAEAAAGADNGENPVWFDGIDVNPVNPNGAPPMCDAMSSAVGSYTESGAGLTAMGACFDMTRFISGVHLTDVDVLKADEEAFETFETLHLFSDGGGDQVIAVLSDHLLAKNLPINDNDPTAQLSPADIIHRIPVGIEPVAMQPSFQLTCDGLDKIDRRPVMLVANRGSQDISVIAVEDYGDDSLPADEQPNPRYGASEQAVISLPIVPTGFFDDLGGPKCAGPYSWVVGEGGEMMPIDMRTLTLPPCKDGACQVASRSRARAGAISRDKPGNARVLIGGQGVLSEVGYLLPSPTSAYFEEEREPAPLPEPEPSAGDDR
jgi:hypothetical protein